MKTSPIFEIYPGKTVYMEPNGNIGQSWKKNPSRRPYKGTVVSVARKYFYVQQEGCRFTEKFEKETFCNHNEDCNSSYILWETEDAWRENLIGEMKLSLIRDFFRGNIGCGYRTAAEIGLDAVSDIYEIVRRTGYVPEKYLKEIDDYGTQNA